MSEARPLDRNAAEGDPFDDGGAGRPGTSLEVSLPQFEGPLDLLLHLVRSQDMDILDLPIAVVARQYNAYLDALRRVDLDVASEYLVMAATLAHIKSRMMLPPEPGEEQAGEDPRAELTRQLLEYEMFRKAAESLAALESGRDLVFVRPGPPPPELAGQFTIKVGLTDLVRAFERVIRQLEAENRVEVIRRDDFNIQDLMQRIVEQLALARKSARVLSFRALASACRTRLERIGLFLALLELMRLGDIEAWQDTPRDDICLGQGTPRVAAASGVNGTTAGDDDPGSVRPAAPQDRTAATSPDVDAGAVEISE